MTPDEQKAALEALNNSLDRIAARLKAAWPDLQAKEVHTADVVVLADWKRAKEAKS